jgi:hypothetical protein
MRFFQALVLLLAGLNAHSALAWGNHSLAAYRAFENMPEVSGAPATLAEPLESFLRAEEYTLEALLAGQEAWAVANIEKYPARPPALAFRAEPSRNDDARRLAFLRALRVASDTRFALYYQQDAWNPVAGSALPYAAVGTLPEPTSAGLHLLALKPGDALSPLAVLASASDEPDYGMDLNLWEDNASDWGKVYGLGPQPYGNPALALTSQLPLHTSFVHESRLVSLAMPSLRRGLVALRSHQFSTLASLAFRTGHIYWGWRFAGLSLHYLQELTYPYQASRAPGESSLKQISAHALALSGITGPEDEMLQLQARRQALLEKYLSEQLLRDAANHQDSGLEKALHALDKDKNYPDWSERYLREVVSAQAARLAPALAQNIVAAFPAASTSEGATDTAKGDSPERQKLDASLAEMMANFAAHSRNGLRGILRASDPF